MKPPATANPPAPHAAPRRATAWVALAALATLGGCALPPPSEPATERMVSEDEQVRIDELRVRGQTQRLTVQPKHGGKAYDIVPAAGGQDLSQSKSSAGQRVWPVLSF